MDFNQFRQQISSAADQIMNQELLKKVGQIGMAGGAAYGGYKALNTTVGQSMAQSASQRIGETYQQAGLTFNEASANRDAYGRAYRPGYRQHEMHDQIINETIATGAGTAAGVGTAALGMAAYRLNPFGGLVGGAAKGLTQAGLTKGFGAVGTLGKAALGGGAAGSAFSAGAQSVGAGAASVAGPVVGAMAGFLPAAAIGYGVNKAAGSIIGNISRQRGAERALDQMSYRFTPGMGSNLLTGRGLGYEETADIARSARETLTDEEYLRQGDFDEILSGITENDLIYNVRGSEEFKRKFEEVTETLRTISRTYEATMEESTELLGEMQRSGFYTTADQTKALLDADSIGRMTGQTGREVIQGGRQGAESARGYGLSGSVGFDTNLRTQMSLERWVQTVDPEERQRFLESIEEVGGMQEAGQSTTEFLLSMSQRGELSLGLFGAMDSEGELDREMLDRYMSGDLTLEEMMAEGNQNIADNPELWSQLSRNPQMAYDQMEDTEFIDFMSHSFDELFRAMGYEDTGKTRDAFLADLGVDSPKLREAIIGAIDGSKLLDETEIANRNMEEQMREDRIEKRSLAGIMERIRNELEGAGETISEPFVGGATGIKNWYRDMRNKWFGFEDVGEVDIGDLDTQFELTPESFLERLSPEHREDIEDSLDMRSGTWREDMDYEMLTGAVERDASTTLQEMYLGDYDKDLTRNQADRLIKDGGLQEIFSDTMGQAMETGINLAGTGKDTFEVEGQEFTLEEFFEDELSSEQMDVLQGITRGLKKELRDVEDPDKRKRIVEKWQEKAEQLVTSGTEVNTIRMSHALKDNYFKMMEGQLRADDATEGADIIKDVRRSDGSLDEMMRELYDDEVIENIRSENQQEIFSIGRDFFESEEGRGRASREGIIRRLEDSDLFRRHGDEISELSGMGREKFGEALQSILSEEFIRTMTDSGAIGYTDKEVEDWEEEWREKIRQEIKDSTETNDNLNKTIEDVNDTLKESHKHLEIAADVYANNNSGISNLFKLPWS